MKSIASVLVVAAALAAPALVHAQTNEPIARAQAHTEQTAAERKIAAQRAASANDSGYGADTNGSAQSGMRGDVTMSSYSPPIRVAR